MPQSANEWIASASIALEPVSAAATAFAKKILKFADSAYNTARVEPDAIYPPCISTVVAPRRVAALAYILLIWIARNLHEQIGFAFIESFGVEGFGQLVQLVVQVVT